MTRDEALALAAQAWCQPTTSGRVIDPALAEVFADSLLATCRRGVEAAQRRRAS